MIKAQFYTRSGAGMLFMVDERMVDAPHSIYHLEYKEPVQVFSFLGSVTRSISTKRATFLRIGTLPTGELMYMFSSEAELPLSDNMTKI